MPCLLTTTTATSTINQVWLCSRVLLQNKLESVHNSLFHNVCFATVNFSTIQVDFEMRLTIYHLNKDIKRSNSFLTFKQPYIKFIDVISCNHWVHKKRYHSLKHAIYYITRNIHVVPKLMVQTEAGDILFDLESK